MGCAKARIAHFELLPRSRSLAYASHALPMDSQEAAVSECLMSKQLLQWQQIARCRRLASCSGKHRLHLKFLHCILLFAANLDPTTIFNKLIAGLKDYLILRKQTCTYARCGWPVGAKSHIGLANPAAIDSHNIDKMAMLLAKSSTKAVRVRKDGSSLSLRISSSTPLSLAGFSLHQGSPRSLSPR